MPPREAQGQVVLVTRLVGVIANRRHHERVQRYTLLSAQLGEEDGVWGGRLY